MLTVILLLYCISGATFTVWMTAKDEGRITLGTFLSYTFLGALFGVPFGILYFLHTVDINWNPVLWQSKDQRL